MPINRRSVALAGIGWTRTPYAQLAAPFSPERYAEAIRARLTPARAS